jgi:hypothetical protein
MGGAPPSQARAPTPCGGPDCTEAVPPGPVAARAVHNGGVAERPTGGVLRGTVQSASSGLRRERASEPRAGLGSTLLAVLLGTVGHGCHGRLATHSTAPGTARLQACAGAAPCAGVHVWHAVPCALPHSRSTSISCQAPSAGCMHVVWGAVRAATRAAHSMCVVARQRAGRVLPSSARHTWLVPPALRGSACRCHAC